MRVTTKFEAKVKHALGHRRLLLAGVALAALMAGEDAHAAECSTSITTALTTNCTISTNSTYSISSSGSLTGATDGMIQIPSSATTTATLDNSGSITSTGSGAAVWVKSGASLSSLINQVGGVMGGADTIAVSGTITSLNNMGTINGYVLNTGTVTTLTNSGTINNGASYGITNSGTLNTLINSQSGLKLSNSGTLRNYAVSVTDASHYGQVTVLSGGGLTLSGYLYATDSYVLGTTYNDVFKLTGSGVALRVNGTSVLNTSYAYTYNGVSYTVAYDSSCTAGFSCYDLTVGSGSSSSNWSAKGIVAGGGASSLGSALDKIASNNALSSQLTALSNLSTTAQYHALKQLSASSLTPSVMSSGATTTPSNLAIDTHLGATVADSSGSRGAAAGDAFQQGGVWGQVLGNHSNLDSSSSGDGFSSNAFGLLVGADVFVTNDAAAGLAFNWLRNKATGKDDASGNSTNTDTYQLSLYGTWRPDASLLWVSGLTSAGLNEYSQKRNIDYLGQTASAKYQGLQTQAKLSSGYDIPMDDGLTLTPQGSLQLSRVQNHGFTETGSSVNQSTDRQGFNNVESVIGGKVTQKFNTDLGTVTADAQAGWLHDYVHSQINSVATLAGVGYVVNTSRLPTNGAQLGLGVTLQESDSLSMRLEYQGDLRPGYASNTGLLKLRETF